jgi:Na+/H+-dicarboxylate symporter
MKLHWKVLLWMLAGVLVGLGMQRWLDAPAWSGVTWEAQADGLRVEAITGPAVTKKGIDTGIRVGDVAVTAALAQGSTDPDHPEQRLPLRTVADAEAAVAASENGEVVWFELTDGAQRMVTLGIEPGSQRTLWIEPFDFVADIFMTLLKMLIVPIILASIVSGVAGVGAFKDLRRLGGKTFGYYISTSLLAIVVGQVLVSVVRPGDGAQLGLAQVDAEQLAPDASFVEVLKRMVPGNIVEAMADNGNMLQVIFFALMFGFFLTQTPSPWRERVTELFDGFFHVMLRMAEGVLKLLPYGVFCLMVRVVAKTGFAVFEPLLLYMGVVFAALLIHAAVTLPLLMKFVGKMSPLAWFKAMSPALMTAFSTSSSSLTLPVSLDTVEKRGGVSNQVTSFTLPLGATINMDGTALYECIGVIFIAQYYTGVAGYELTFAAQAMVVLMALLASIGAAGIPSAGLVMMLSILGALGLPLEGAALLLAVDRPLDMLRTVVNVWSDTCGAAVIARTEGETGPLRAPLPA